MQLKKAPATLTNVLDLKVGLDFNLKSPSKTTRNSNDTFCAHMTEVELANQKCVCYAYKPPPSLQRLAKDLGVNAEQYVSFCYMFALHEEVNISINK